MAAPLLRVAAFALVGVTLRKLRDPPAVRPEEPPPLSLPPPLPPAEDAAGAASDVEAAAGECALCRFCFGDARDGDLISPCACRGTQAHVHTGCLREWQRASLVTRGTSEEVCRVCATRFALPRPPLRVLLRDWFAPRAADRLHIWTCAWTQVLAATLLPLHEPHISGVRDVLTLLAAAEARVLTARELRRGRPGLQTLRNAALASDLLHSSAVLCWLAALGTACAGDVLHACGRAVTRRRARVVAMLLTPAARVLTGASSALLLPVRLMRLSEPLHRVVAFVERFPQYRL
jgi:hypothetical protein